MNYKDWTVQKRLLSARRASQMAVFDIEIEWWGKVDVPYLLLREWKVLRVNLFANRHRTCGNAIRDLLLDSESENDDDFDTHLGQNIDFMNDLNENVRDPVFYSDDCVIKITTLRRTT
ncbi:hypothetical protein J6590_060545 [Homalodisca vitripennis]|nr:hypothetical protein J6590_060545 [Homalodisca vitripennis]